MTPYEVAEESHAFPPVSSLKTVRRIVGAADEGDHAAVGCGDLTVLKSRGVEGVGDDVVAIGPVRSREGAEVVTHEVRHAAIEASVFEPSAIVRGDLLSSEEGQVEGAEGDGRGSVQEALA